MQDLGEVGFWLAVGIIAAASILSDARKERETTRQKQETLRALLTTDGKSTTEILAYLRERDAAEEKRKGDQRVALDKAVRKVLAALAAFVVGIVSLFVSVRAFSGAGHLTQSWPIAVGLMLGVWAGGALIAFLIYVLIRGKKNVPPPGA